MSTPPRTTAQAVRDVLAPGKDYDDRRQPALEPFIAAASSLVDRVRQCGIDDGEPYTLADLTLIETWLAAHYYKCSDRQYQSKSTAGASAGFTGQTGEGLKSTMYGQVALDLDWNGCLSNEFASSDWLGKPASERIPYRDRN